MGFAIHVCDARLTILLRDYSWIAWFTYATRVPVFFFFFFFFEPRFMPNIHVYVREIRYSSDYLISMVLSSFNFSCIVSQMNHSSRRMELREIVGRDFSRRECNNETGTDFAKLNIASGGYLYGKIEISRERKIQNCNCDFCVWSFHHRTDFLRIELTKRKTNVKQIVQSDPDLCPLMSFFLFTYVIFISNIISILHYIRVYVLNYTIHTQ